MQARFLANHFHCYALDNRGSGDSFIQTPEIGDGVYHGSQSIFEAQDEVPTLQGFAEDIIAVVDHLNYTGISHHTYRTKTEVLIPRYN